MKEKRKKEKKSGSATFINWVIAAALLVASLCFVLYYGGTVRQGVVLWVGIVAFTVFYHLWLRILMGRLTAQWRIRHSHWWFRPRPFEKRLHRLLRVRRWKERVLTYDPAAFSTKNHTLEEIANTMSKAETDHWINQLISLTTLLFAIPWGFFWGFLISAVCAMLFDAQFIVVQRYNRPVVLRVLERQRKRAERQA